MVGGALLSAVESWVNFLAPSGVEDRERHWLLISSIGRDTGAFEKQLPDWSVDLRDDSPSIL